MVKITSMQTYYLLTLLVPCEDKNVRVITLAFNDETECFVAMHAMRAGGCLVIDDYRTIQLDSDIVCTDSTFALFDAADLSAGKPVSEELRANIIAERKARCNS